MPHYMYVAVQGDNKISVFTVDPQTGDLTPQADVSVPGGPSPMAISPDSRYLYAGCREVQQIVSFQIDQANGGLTPNGSVGVEAWPTYIATDRKGKFVLSAYYQGAHVGVHPIADDGSVGGAPIEWLETATGAHAMQTDPTNTYAFVPHIAGNGPNSIYQFRFDENTGHISYNTPPSVEPAAFSGPRHFCFHPSLTSFTFPTNRGAALPGIAWIRRKEPWPNSRLLPPSQKVLMSGIPCSQIQVAASGRFLFAPNRGHDSIACFTVDTASGELSSNGIVASEARPNALCLGPGDRFIYSAGQDSGQMATFSVDQQSGALTRAGTLPLGNGPCWLSVTELPG